MVEQRSPKPRAEGSSPSAPAKKKKSRFTALFSFSFVQTVLKTRHAERVEGCGSPVETSKHRRCLEAPTEPAGEKKSFCPWMAQRSKYGVTPPYFGHRKRGCEATSSPFVYHRQSFGDNYRFCFTAILLTFPI